MSRLWFCPYDSKHDLLPYISTKKGPKNLYFGCYEKLTPGEKSHERLNTITCILKMRMLEKSEWLQSGLNHRWLFFLVRWAELILRFNSKSSWLEESFQRKPFGVSLFSPLGKIIWLTVKFLREDNLAGVKVNLYLGLGSDFRDCIKKKIAQFARKLKVIYYDLDFPLKVKQ